MPSHRWTALIAVSSAGAGILAAVAARPEPRTLVVTEKGDAYDHAALGRVLPVFDLRRVPYRLALRQWAEQAGVGLVIHERTLEAAGVDLDAPVDVRLVNVSAAAALDTLLRYHGHDGSMMRLGHWISAGQVGVSTVEDATQQSATMRIYPVGELIEHLMRIDHPFFESTPVFDHPVPPTQPVARGWVPGGSFGPPPSPQQTLPSGPMSREEAVDHVAALIRDGIGPGTWIEDGGSIGSMREWGDLLIVTQTPANHDRIAVLLHQLDAAVASGKRPPPTTRPLRMKIVWE